MIVFLFLHEFLNLLYILAKLSLSATHEIEVVRADFLVLHRKLLTNLVSIILFFITGGRIERAPKVLVLFIMFSSNNGFRHNASKVLPLTNLLLRRAEVHQRSVKDWWVFKEFIQIVLDIKLNLWHFGYLLSNTT